MTLRIRSLMTLLAVLAPIAAAPAYAQQYGVRGGASGPPNQVFIGAQADTTTLGHEVTFRPNVELAFGNAEQLLSLNMELVHWMPLHNPIWSLYAGGGVGANFIFSNEFEDRMHGNLSALFGLQHQSGLFGELKVGLRPSIQLTVGYMFPRR